MRFQITEEMKKRIFVNSCSLVIPLLLFMFFNQFEQIKDFVNTILVICFPFVFGVAIAFLLYNPQNWLEKKLFENSKFSASKKRLLSTLLTFLIVLVILALLCATIIPSIIDSILTFAQNISDYTENFTHYAYTIANSLNISTQDIQLWTENLRIVETLTDTVTSTLPKLATYSYGFVRGIINFILAVVSGFYILLDREKLIRVIKKLNYSVFNLDTAKGLNYWIIDVKTVFEQYIVGNIIDSTIIGITCYIGTLIFQIPYAPMIGLIVGVTNLIPVFGPFLGAIPVIVILLLINPISAFIFAIFILILQQIDGNVIKPIVLGDKLGMSGFWILFSVTIGGGLFGILGMFLGVPVFALFYSALREYSNLRLKSKHIEI